LRKSYAPTGCKDPGGFRIVAEIVRGLEIVFDR